MTCIKNPANLIKIVWISLGEWRGYWFTALGVHTIAGFIKKNCPRKLDQKVWYYNRKDIHSLLNCLVSDTPDYICLSVNIGYLERTLELIEQIASVLKSIEKKDVRFVFGNREFLDAEKVARVLDLVPDSLIVKGEGEEPILKILDQSSLDTIPNLYYKRDKKLFYTFDKRLNANNHIAPLYEIPIINDEPLGLNQQVAYVEVSRGCSKRPPCTFCSNSANPQKWQALNISQVIESITKVAQNKPIAINFVSEDFLGVNNKAIVVILDHLERMKSSGLISPATSFYCAIRTTDVHSNRENDRQNEAKRATLKRMKNLGFNTLYIGFESGSNAQLKRYAKGVTREENIKAIRVLKGLNIHIDGGFITFDPLMSLDDCIQNISFLRRADVPKLLLFPFNRLVMFPGTAYQYMYKQRKKTVNPKTEKLLRTIEYIDTFIPYGLFELFLQRLRLYYFANTERDEIERYEKILRDYGNLTLNFLDNLVFALSENHLDSQLNPLVNDFLQRHTTFSNDLHSWFRRKEPELFVNNAIPDFKDVSE